MTCHVCHRDIKPLDSVVNTGGGLSHKACGAVRPVSAEAYERAWGGGIDPASDQTPVVLRRSAPADSALTLRALTDDLLAALHVLNDESHLRERGGVVIPEAQLLNRARNIAAGMWGNFAIELLPAEEDTVPMAAARP